jgi:aspartate kinase
MRMEANKNPLIVQKFGGTSLATTGHISCVAESISKASQKKRLVIVVSAMAGATNESIAKCLEISTSNTHLALEAYDSAVSSCENLSAALLTLALLNKGILAKAMQGWQIPIITNDCFSRAKILSVNRPKIMSYVEQGIIPVICGFQGVTKENTITTLGRGGSDTTAVAVAAALEAQRCEIYTDVDGVFSADPRLVSKVLKIDSISHEEMLLFSRYGAKVLERRSVEISMRYNVPLEVIATNSQTPGTKVSQQSKDLMESPQIKGITLKNDIIFCTITTLTIEALIERLKEISCSNLIINHFENSCQFEAPLSEKSKIDTIVADKSVVRNYHTDSESALVVLIGWSIGEDCQLLDQIWKELQPHKTHVQQIFLDTHIIKIKVPLRVADAIVKHLHSALIEKPGKD